MSSKKAGFLPSSLSRQLQDQAAMKMPSAALQSGHHPSLSKATIIAKRRRQREHPQGQRR